MCRYLLIDVALSAFFFIKIDNPKNKHVQYNAAKNEKFKDFADCLTLFNFPGIFSIPCVPMTMANTLGFSFFSVCLNCRGY